MGECHECYCGFSPPCGPCERCVHFDHTECPEDCQTCEYDHERTGPYRLLDGTWSDGVDRAVRISERDGTAGRFEVWSDSWGSWQAYRYPLDSPEELHEEFHTHAEAVAYADWAARRQG